MKASNISGNISWKFAERILKQGIAVVISIILARLLSPDDYGVIALVNVFILIANVFVSNGIGTALIQDKDAEEETFSTDLFISIALGIVLYGILYFAAVPISAFYSNSSLVPVIRVLSLQLPLASLSTISNAIVARKMQFKKLFVPTVTSTLVSGAAGIALAYLGFGVWALVAQTLVNQIVFNILLFSSLKWIPRLVFRVDKALQHAVYGIRITAAALLNTFVGQLNALVIGKHYSGSDLAYYDNGTKYPQVLMGVVQDAVGSVMFPAIANEKDSAAQVKELMRTSIRYTSFLIAPLMLGFALCAEHAVSLLLTDKWLPSVPYMRIICIIYLFMPMNSVNYEGVKAIGKSSLFLKIQIYKSIMNVAILLLVYRYGVLAIALSALVGNIGILCMNAYPSHKYIGYTFAEQLTDLTRAWRYSLPFVIALLIFNHFVHLGSLLMLLSNIVIGFVLYPVSAYLQKADELKFVLNIFKKS